MSDTRIPIANANERRFKQGDFEIGFKQYHVISRNEIGVEPSNFYIVAINEFSYGDRKFGIESGKHTDSCSKVKARHYRSVVSSVYLCIESVNTFKREKQSVFFQYNIRIIAFERI